MRFRMSHCRLLRRVLKIYIHRSDTCTYTMLQHCLVVIATQLVSHKTAAVSAHVLRTPYNHAPVYSVLYVSSIPLISGNLKMFYWLHTPRRLLHMFDCVIQRSASPLPFAHIRRSAPNRAMTKSNRLCSDKPLLSTI